MVATLIIRYEQLLAKFYIKVVELPFKLCYLYENVIKWIIKLITLPQIVYKCKSRNRPWAKYVAGNELRKNIYWQIEPRRKNIYHILEVCDKGIYTFLYTLLCILCTLPVNNASLKQTFLTLHLIKIWLKSWQWIQQKNKNCRKVEITELFFN